LTRRQDGHGSETWGTLCSGKSFNPAQRGGSPTPTDGAARPRWPAPSIPHAVNLTRSEVIRTCSQRCRFDALDPEQTLGRAMSCKLDSYNLAWRLLSLDGSRSSRSLCQILRGLDINGQFNFAGQISGSCCRMPSEAEPPASDQTGVLVVADDVPYCLPYSKSRFHRAFRVPAVARRIVIEPSNCN
jgi:hypothetical protein